LEGSNSQNKIKYIKGVCDKKLYNDAEILKYKKIMNNCRREINYAEN